MYLEQSVDGIRVKNFNLEEEDCEIQKPQM